MLEVNHEIGQYLLIELCRDCWEGWSDTLNFQDDLSTYFLFSYEGQRVRFLPSQFDGLKIHAGNLLLIPPCWFVTGICSTLLEPRRQAAQMPGMAARTSPIGRG